MSKSGVEFGKHECKTTIDFGGTIINKEGGPIGPKLSYKF